MAGWSGDADAPGWLKVLASLADLAGAMATPRTGAEPALALPDKPWSGKVCMSRPQFGTSAMCRSTPFM